MDRSGPWVWQLHIGSCLFLTGLIWLVQWVHYPAFRFADKAQFSAFHSFHSSRITMIVGPLMLLELVTAGLLWQRSPTSGPLMANLIGIGLIWATTFLLNVPAHNILAHGYDAEAIRTLTVTNWPRTILWTLRAAMLLLAGPIGQSASAPLP